jgi:hypothetical protein
MICGKVVYLPGNSFVSGYCGLPPNHKEPCLFVPEEYLVQICKQVLIDRGEVIVPLRRRSDY